MEVKTLEKAYKILEKVKTLDNEIIKIDKVAGIIISQANGKSNSSFELRVKDYSKENSKDSILDEDGSLKTGSLSHEMENPFSWLSKSFFPLIQTKEEEEDKHTYSLNYQLSESATLKILSVLLNEKKQEREALLVKLQKFGFEI